MWEGKTQNKTYKHSLNAQTLNQMGVWAPVIFRFSLLRLSKHLRFWQVISSGSYSNVYKFSFIWIAIKVVFNWVIKGADFKSGTQWLQRLLNFAWFRKKNENTVLALLSIFLKLWEFPQILRARFDNMYRQAHIAL